MFSFNLLQQNIDEIIFELRDDDSALLLASVPLMQPWVLVETYQIQRYSKTNRVRMAKKRTRSEQPVSNQ